MILSRFTRITGITAAAALLLAACSSGSSGGTSTTSSPGAATSTAGSSSAGSSSAGSSSTAAGSGSTSSSAAPSSGGSVSSGSPGSSTAAGGGGAGGTLIIGSNTFDESVLLMNIWAEALKAKGVAVETKPKVGDRPVYLPALKDGSIDMVPEYTGSLLVALGGSETLTTPDEVYAALPGVLGSDLKVYDKSNAEDKDSINVTPETSAKYNLKSIADFAPVAGDLILGGAPLFETRKDGVPALAEKYGVTFGQFKGADINIIIDDLKNNRIDAADLYTTDPSIKANGFVTLEDPKAFTAAQNVLPLIRADKSTPEIEQALNAVSAKLTTDTLIDLNTKVAAGTDSVTVAKEWLTSQGLA